MRTLFCTLCAVAVTSTASAQVVILGDLTSGSTATGTLMQSTGDADGIDLSDAPFWGFWTFSANVGDIINIEVDRLANGLDPVSSVVQGNAGGLAFGSLTGTSIFDWSGPGLSPNLASGDDDDPPASGGGPFGDPNYSFIAALSGTYTVAVASFLSVNPFPAGGYGYEITVTGSTVPAPGALALLGVAGLVVGGRRRRA